MRNGPGLSQSTGTMRPSSGGSRPRVVRTSGQQPGSRDFIHERKRNNDRMLHRLGSNCIRDASARLEFRAVAHARPIEAKVVTCTSEVLFVDPAIDDLGRILGGLRPGIEAIVLDPVRPAAR